ncbi:MAG: CPBP family intramembrane metalloprotease, partial [Treponema sp.]|nr:CPBP family intramembrane metalloprotease [Treponema sp.]
MNLDKYRRPFVFFGFAIGVPWVVWSITGVISHSGLWENYNWVIFGSILAFLGLLAPTVTAFVLILPDKEMRDELKSATFSFKGVHWIWFAYTLLFPFAVILLAQAISLLFGHSAAQFKVVEQFSFSAGIFPVWVLFIIVPVIEEFGWRTYGTHCIRRKYNLFVTSIIFGVLWAIWHMPLSFINGYYHSNLVETGAIYSLNYSVSLIPYLIIDGWVY